VAEVVKKSKYHPKSFALLRLLSFSGAKIASKLGFDFTGFTVIPIPISKLREKDRGFNQADIIAKAVYKEFGLTVDTSILNRIRDTNKQFGLHKVERAQNITGAFAVKGDVTGGKFLLVDDICTTGSTLITASQALFDAGALDVRCFTLSRKI
jgi:ComF family protein